MIYKSHYVAFYIETGIIGLNGHIFSSLQCFKMVQANKLLKTPLQRHPHLHLNSCELNLIQWGAWTISGNQLFVFFFFYYIYNHLISTQQLSSALINTQNTLGTIHNNLASKQQLSTWTFQKKSTSNKSKYAVKYCGPKMEHYLPVVYRSLSTKNKFETKPLSFGQHLSSSHKKFQSRGILLKWLDFAHSNKNKICSDKGMVTFAKFLWNFTATVFCQ